MTDIEHGATKFNAPRRDRLPNRRCAMRAFAWDRDGSKRRAGFYVELLTALRYETFIARCQLAKAHDKDERELLAGRLDLTDTRAADIAARLHSMGAP